MMMLFRSSCAVFLKRSGIIALLLTVTYSTPGLIAHATSQVYTEVDKLPEIIGGVAALQNSIKYPESARKAGVEGKVFVTFIVDKQGNVQNPTVERRLGAGLDEAAIEAVSKLKFEPGLLDGEAVSVRLVIPITFKLPELEGEEATPTPPPSSAGGSLAALQATVKYPEIAYRAGIEGTVYVTFSLDEQGNAQNPTVERRLGAGLDEAAIEAVRSFRFASRADQGNTVKVQMTVPIVFELSPTDRGVDSIHTDIIYTKVEELPELIGGMQALLANLHYPEAAQRAGIQGTVYVTFVVDEQGNVLEPTVAKPLSAGLDETAIEAVRQAKFTPGRHQGKTVKVRMTIPVTFQM